jgi:tetratricopeptide (TPR) repeat protein
MIELCVKGNEVYPMIYYFIGWYYCKNGKYEKGETLFKKARQMPKDYCFPNRLEEVVVLQYITKNYPNDAEANYYLGNFWYANRQYQDAQKCWNRSMQLDPKNPICIRNLGLYYYNNAAQKDKAIKLLEKSFELDNKNARVLMELDQLYKKMNVSIDERLNLLESNLSLTLSRDDLYLERVALYNIKGDYHEALRLINQWQFHPWEGGEGRVPFHYIMANVEIAKELISDKKFQKAIEYLEAAQVFPNNLGEGKLIGAQENDINYWLGCAYEGLDNYGKANEFWYKASKGLAVLSSAIFYNDQQPDKIFYQGLALLKLADIKGALIMFNNLLEYGKTHLNDEVKIDYFAISLPDLLIWDEDLNVRNKIHCNYLIGLGYLGLSQFGNSISAFMRVKDKDLYHLPGRIHLKMTKDLNLI